MFSLKVIGPCLVALSMIASGGATAANPIVIMETNKGTVKIELYEDKAPVTVKNFLSYVEDKHYDGLVFHRVIKDFMIQGGGFEPGMKEKKTKPAIINESINQISNTKGTLAMARTSDPNSATSQFFINLKDNTFLDRAKAKDKVGYCVFGRVIDGMDIVEKIATAETGNKNGFDDVPTEDIVIKSIKLKKENN